MPALLIAATVAAQYDCKGGSCRPTAAYRGLSYQVQQSAPREVYYQPPQIAPIQLVRNAQENREYAWYNVPHKGVDVDVWGYLSADGRCHFVMQGANLDNYIAAVKAKAEKEADRKRNDAKADEPMPTARIAGRDTTKLLTGVEPSMMGGSGYTSSGSTRAQRFIESTKALSRQAQEKSAETKPFVTVIGKDKEKTKEIIRDWRESPELADARKTAWLNEFEPEEWQVEGDLGYHGNGDPTILVQRADDGGVELRANEYPGAEILGVAVRKASPGYDPAKDPKPEKAKPVVKPKPDDSAGWLRITLFVLLGILALAAVIPRKGPP